MKSLEKTNFDLIRFLPDEELISFFSGVAENLGCPPTHSIKDCDVIEADKSQCRICWSNFLKAKIYT